MPSVIIHEKVGQEIGKKKNISSYNYYLGILSPDAVNLEEFAPKEERWMSHQRRKDLNEWRDAITKFYEQEKDHYPEDFIFGYFIHVLTDIIYDDYFYLPVKEEIIKEHPEKEAHSVMREDMTKYSFPGIDQIKDILSKEDTSYDVLNISKERLKKWKEKQISLWKEENTSEYITEEMIQNLVEEVEKECKELIGK